MSPQKNSYSYVLFKSFISIPFLQSYIIFRLTVCNTILIKLRKSKLTRYTCELRYTINNILAQGRF